VTKFEGGLRIAISDVELTNTLGSEFLAEVTKRVPHEEIYDSLKSNRGRFPILRPLGLSEWEQIVEDSERFGEPPVRTLELDIVYSQYRSTANALGKVPGKAVDPVIKIIRHRVPQFLKDSLVSMGRDIEKYRIYGSVGQVNFSFARIPWVGIFDARVTDNAQQGYYIVLLFSEGMDGCFLSLNQGYTQFYDVFGTDELAVQQIQATAQRALDFLDIPKDFFAGEINLAATKNLGVGYEKGAIVSRYYKSDEPDLEEVLTRDLQALLSLYDRLIDKVGKYLVDSLPPVSEDDFQTAAISLAHDKKKVDLDMPAGPIPPPVRMEGNRGGGYKRKVAVSAAAISRSEYRCEYDSTHRTFVSGKTLTNFVEAHHLVPMQFQAAFKVSLDVPENVVALCPVCHRLLHHARTDDRVPLLKGLHSARLAGLTDRGIPVTLEELARLYRAEIKDD
jgi:5-methylcytosine-specific restriction protein A